MRHSLRRPSVIISLMLLAACAVFWHRGNRHAEFLRIDRCPECGTAIPHQEGNSPKIETIVAS